MAGTVARAKTNPAQNADNMFTPDQGNFIAAFHAYTKLDVNVIGAWVLSENAAGGQNGAQNWLGVGITDSGRVGNTSSVWDSPVTAAEATAAWGQGDAHKLRDMGFTQFQVASPEIQQKIFQSYMDSPAVQIAGIKYNGPGGWSTGGEPAIQGAYDSIIQAGGINLQNQAWFDRAKQYTPGSSSGVVYPDNTLNPSGIINDITSPFTSVADFLSKWFSPSGLLRLAKLIGGFVIVFMSLRMLMRQEAGGKLLG